MRDGIVTAARLLREAGELALARAGAASAGGGGSDSPTP
jgi:hypothetical protein